MSPIRVVAGILRDDGGRVLVAERLGDSPFGGLWEFPGGKIAAGESASDALRRELAEELGVTALRLEHYMDVEHRYADRHVSIRFFLVTDWHPEPRSLDGQALEWIDPRQTGADSLLPADAPVLEALRGQARDGS
ncbi:MAG: 8-oxo-dGTP diphosphatase MutT [Woeseiaceae bacterium]